MSGFKHTKGPWYPDKNGNIWRRHPDDLYENGGGVAGDKPIASANIGWVGDDFKGYPLDANTTLIAAAPEMLDALIHQYRWVKALCDLYKIDQKKYPDSDLIKTERDLKELIERATGLTIDEAIKAYEADNK